MREIPAGRFKARCLALLDEVAGGEEIVVTKHGRPVARLIPPEPPPDLRGTVTYMVPDEELWGPTVVPDAERGILDPE